MWETEAKRQYDAEHYQQNKPRLLAYQKKYYQKNREKVLARAARYRARKKLKELL